MTTGLVFYTGTIYWTVEVMAGYGGLSVPVAMVVGFLLAAYLSVYLAAFAWLLRRAVRLWGTAGAWTAPLLWVATEWARSTVGGGFPWVLLGSSQAPVVPVVQAASVAGVYGLSALLVLVSTAAALVGKHGLRRHRTGVAAVAVSLVTVVVWGSARVSRGTLTTGPTTRVGLVQGNIAQENKHDPRFRDEILARYLALSRQVIAEGARLVIWPESATPFYFDLDSALAAPVRQLARETGTPFLLGTDQYEPDLDGGADRYYNSAVLLGSDGQTHGAYRKMQLVPFGEYVPLKSLLFFVSPLVEAVSDFTAGTEPAVLDAGSLRVSVAICYESVYPGLARAFVEGGSELLATVTNDAWFGRSSAAYQHFEQGALRAVEQGRYVVRAANTGISGAVDPYGRVLTTTDLFEPAARTVDIRPLDVRTIYSRTGDVLVWLGLVLAGWLVVSGWRTRAGQS